MCVHINCVGTMMCKVPYSSCKVVTAHRESPQVPTVRLGGTVQYYAEQHGVQCHAVEHCGHESSSFSPLLQVLYRVKTLRREAHRTVVPVVALLYRRLREHAFTLCLQYGKRTRYAALNVSNPHPWQAVFTHNDAWSPQILLNSRRAVIGGGCPLSCPAVDAKLRVSRAAFTNRGMY